jgi:long-chain acyl-CoA synthetase
MDKIWLKSYLPGVPAEVDPTQLRSLKDLIEQTCAVHADRIAFVQMDVTLTYRRLEELSRAFAAWLQRTGLKKGDRIAIMLPNTLQYPMIALFGALRAGLIVVNTNPLYTAPELQHQLSDSGAIAIVVLENFAHVLQQVLPRTAVKHVLVTAAGDLLSFPKSYIVNFVVRHVRKQVPVWNIPVVISFKAALNEGLRLQLAPVDVGPEDLAFLQYTGGTTGVAKGAMLSHANVSTNTLQAQAWLGDLFHGPGVLITAIPLYHIFALSCNCMLFARLGWKNVLIINPRDQKALIRDMQKYPCDFLSGVNTLFNAILNAPGFDKIDFSRLKITLGGGMAVQPAVAQRWKKATGNVLTQAWGLTETSPAACINRAFDDFNGSIGLPISSTEVSIKNDAGNDLQLGEVGEICVRGPQVMRGYWNRPDETAKVMLPDGWLRTGDVGRMDARGLVYIEDRKKDMILVSGFNVYPNEVEAAAAECPRILEAAAVAQRDEHSGEVVALFVVPKDPTLTEREVIEYCRKSLAGYKVPKHVYFRTELPKTNVGKILRKTLREELSKN